MQLSDESFETYELDPPSFSFYTTKKDGGTDWQYRLVGIYTLDDKRFGQHIPAAGFFVRFDYYEELTPYPGQRSRSAISSRLPAGSLK